MRAEKVVLSQATFAELVVALEGYSSVPVPVAGAGAGVGAYVSP